MLLACFWLPVGFPFAFRRLRLLFFFFVSRSAHRALATRTSPQPESGQHEKPSQQKHDNRHGDPRVFTHANLLPLRAEAPKNYAGRRCAGTGTPCRVSCRGDAADLENPITDRLFTSPPTLALRPALRPGEEASKSSARTPGHVLSCRPVEQGQTAAVRSRVQRVPAPVILPSRRSRKMRRTSSALGRRHSVADSRQAVAERARAACGGRTGICAAHRA